eukprot:5642899-Pyramimonas_sp.AAC.1
MVAGSPGVGPRVSGCRSAGLRVGRSPGLRVICVAMSIFASRRSDCFGALSVTKASRDRHAALSSGLGHDLGQVEGPGGIQLVDGRITMLILRRLMQTMDET